MGYITSKDLTGNNASTGRARQQDIDNKARLDKLVEQLLEGETEKKKKKVPKKKKSTGDN
jgi:hypothetical protein